MWFCISKTILYLMLPPASMLIIMAAGFFIMKFCRGLGKALVAAGFISLYLLSINLLSNALLKPLESYAPPLKAKYVRADAVVVLGGGVSDLAWLGLPSEPSCHSLERVVKAIILYRRLHLPFVLMGGNGDPYRTVTADADAMQAVALTLGVRSKNIILENKSRNTIESAAALPGLIKGRRIILVTSAYHMRRAAGIFRKEGFDVIPAPTGYRSEQRNLSFYSFIPRARSLADSSAACSEYLSLFWYGHTGRL